MVRATCAVYGCMSKSYHDKGLSFFSFPKDKERQLQWVRMIGRPDLKNSMDIREHMRVCSLHFEKNMFKNKKLQPYAIPTINFQPTPMISAHTQTNEETYNSNQEFILEYPLGRDIKLEPVESYSGDIENDLSVRSPKSKKRKLYENAKSVQTDPQPISRDEFLQGCDLYLNPKMSVIVKTQVELHRQLQVFRKAKIMKEAAFADVGQPSTSAPRIFIHKHKVGSEGDQQIGESDKDGESGETHQDEASTNQEVSIDYAPGAMQEFQETLVHQVVRYPCLYDVSSPAHGNALITDRVWKDIGRAVKSTDNICKSTWEEIQESYTKSLTQSTPYHLASLLQFLDPHIRKNREEEPEMFHMQTKQEEAVDPLTWELKTELEIEENTLHLEHSIQEDARNDNKDITIASLADNSIKITTAGVNTKEEITTDSNNKISIISLVDIDSLAPNNPVKNSSKQSKSKPAASRRKNVNSSTANRRSARTRRDPSEKYLLSLLPHVKKMSEEQKLAFNRRIGAMMQEIDAEIEETEEEEDDQVGCSYVFFS